MTLLSLLLLFAQVSTPAYVIILPIVGGVAVAIITGWFLLASAKVTAAAQKAQKVATEKAAEATEKAGEASDHAEALKAKDELIDALRDRVEFLEEDNKRMRELMNEFQQSASIWSDLQRGYEQRLSELERAGTGGDHGTT